MYDKRIKHKFNHSWFKSLDIPDKVYYTFFILGDGHLNKNGYRIEINIDDDDKYILKRLLDEINGNYSSLRYNQTHSNIIHLSLNSKEMVRDLNNHGIPLGNKKYIAKWIDVNDKLKYHAVRGILDSDGNIQVYKRGKNLRKSLLFRVIGTKNVCTNVSKILGYNGKNVYEKEPNSIGGFTYIFAARLTQYKDLLNLYNKIYPNSDVPHLTRKRKRFEEVLFDAQNFEEKQNNVIKRINQLRGEGLSFNKIGKKINLSATTTRRKYLEGLS